MPEFELEFATRQIRRTFERAIGKSIPKIITELVANSDDSYRRLAEARSQSQPALSVDPSPIFIVFDRAKKKFSIIDRAEGMTDEEMKMRFATYGQESTDRSKGYKTRSLFGKGLRDVLFTQRNGQVKSIKNGLFYNCRFRWKGSHGRERPIIDIKAPSRVTPELREALLIPQNGTQVEFILKEDVPTPQLEKLISTLSNFYLLRMINSSPHREVRLIAPGRKGRAEYQLSYRFPEIEVVTEFEDSFVTDVGTEIQIKSQVGVTSEEMSQGEASYSDREGGLLVLDEDDAVLDLQLFGFDHEPAARSISGTIRLLGAGEYIRSKLNQAEPEEVLTETRDGFTQQHPFFQKLRKLIHGHLEPIVDRLREVGPKPKVTLSDKTRERHQQAMDMLNRLASEMLGKTARVPAVPASKRTPPPEGIAFVNPQISVQTGLVTPAVLLINTSLVSSTDIIEITSDMNEIHVQPLSLMRGDDADAAGVALKILRIRSDVADLNGRIIARWKNVQVEMEVITTARSLLTPVDGLEFERDQYSVRLNATRHLRLFVDANVIPVGSEIAITTDSDALVISRPKVVFETAHLITPQVGELKIAAQGVRVNRDIIVTASVAQYVAGAKISVVKKEKEDRGKEGLFRGYRFQPLERKVQTQWLTDGYVLINTKDPVNSRYFGEDPGKAVEEYTHCQVRLADLVLNECLQIMVSQALETGRLDRRFPNNPEIDLRNYVDEKKFEIGAAIHEKFVTKTN